MLNQNDINNVENVIQEVINSLVVCRQRIEELHIEKEPHDKMKENMDLIKSSQQQFHHIINQYFQELGENFRSLQSRYPNSEIKKQLLLKLEDYTQQLDQYAQKIDNLSQQDYDNFKQQNYPLLINELTKEIEELATYTQKSNKQQDSEPLPQVKVNHRVVEGLYLTLNDYASVQWSGDIPPENCNKPIIENQGGFPYQQLILLDDFHKSYCVYDIEKNECQYNKLNANIQIDYNSTIIYGEPGIVYLLGGVTQQGLISGKFYQLNIDQNEITQLPEMNVKRVGASAILVREGDCQFLYVIGGKTDNKVKTKLCERFNFTTQKWEYITKMNHARANAGIAIQDSFIYIFFGVDSENQNCNVIERYNYKQTKMWETIEIQNFLPGFDSSNCTAIAINKQQILILGGIRYSLYFQDQMYFNRKLLVFNSTNNTFSVLDYQMPIDFIPYANLIIYKNEIFGIGYTMKQVEDKPTIFLDGGFVVKITKDFVKLIKYISAIQQ